MEAVLLLLKHGANVNAMADQRHDYRTVSIFGYIPPQYVPHYFITSQLFFTISDPFCLCDIFI